MLPAVPSTQERAWCSLHFSSWSSYQFRRVEMFTWCTETFLKEKIVASFADPASHLRIVIGTIAFGMGLDFPVSAMWSTLDLLQTLRVMSRRLDVVVGIESSVPPFCFIQKQTSSTRRRVWWSIVYLSLMLEISSVERQKLFDDFDGGVEDPAIAMIFV